MEDTERLKQVWSIRHPRKLLSAEQDIFPTFLEIAKVSDSILEVGAGDGRMIEILKTNGVKARFYALDLVENVKDIPAKAVIGDARFLPFPDNSFDFVYSLGVVEHFPETLKAIQEHARVVKNGGKVLLTVPRWSLGALLRWYYFIKNREYRKASYEIVKGRNIRLSQMKSYLQQANLHALDLRATGYIVWLKPDFRIDKWLAKVLPRKRFGSFLFCLAEKTQSQSSKVHPCFNQNNRDS